MAEISVKQHKAAEALLTTATIAEAAEVAGIGERTLYRWLNDPDFSAHVTELEAKLIDAAQRQLLRLQSDAISTMEEIMNDIEVPASVRLRAADSVLSHAFRLRDLSSIEQRLAALETV